MNRREFTASLAALAAAPALPFARVAAAATVLAVPAGAYAWGQLIARAQNRCSPAMLAKHLNLQAEVATTLFNDMVRDGVLRAPGMAGVARATAPIQTSAASNYSGQRVTEKAKHLLEIADPKEERRDEPTPLVNPDQQGLGCEQPLHEDQTDASTDQPSQESPERG